MPSIEDSVVDSIELGRNNILRNANNIRQLSMENDVKEEN
jgi:hypothetical protein